MNFKSVEIISSYCKNDFIESPESNTLLVFLPAVNGKDIYPYYPRRSWGTELSKKYHVLYISDPYQPLSEYSEPMGSWFISPEGVSTIETLAEKIKLFMIDISVENVIFYGSSMGGYAAIILSSLIKDSKAIAECPQLYLNKHPGSRFVCENILHNDIPQYSIEPLNFLKNGQQRYVNISCSIFDRHFELHILPFLEDCKTELTSKEISVSVNIYNDSSYKKGHVALRKEDAFSLLKTVSDI